MELWTVLIKGQRGRWCFNSALDGRCTVECWPTRCIAEAEAAKITAYKTKVMKLTGDHDGQMDEVLELR